MTQDLLAAAKWMEEFIEAMNEDRVTQDQRDLYASMLQAARAAIVEAEASQAGWVEWAGGVCPVAHGSRVDVRHRDGGVFPSVLAGFGEAEDWSIDPDRDQGGDIMAYRIAKAERV